MICARTALRVRPSFDARSSDVKAPLRRSATIRPRLESRSCFLNIRVDLGTPLTYSSYTREARCYMQVAQPPGAYAIFVRANQECDLQDKNNLICLSLFHAN